MTRLKDVCRHIRSKNAGPYWVTVDLFFDSKSSFDAFADHPAISTSAIGALFGVDPGLVKRFAVPDLNVVKISYPRPTSQGGMVELDLHSGQQYVSLLSLDLA